MPADPAAYRCDRIARDVEALRADLGLDQMDLLGHSRAGTWPCCTPPRIQSGSGT